VNQTYENILTDRPARGIFRITLNRPNKRNALGNYLRRDLFAALEAADVDSDVRVTVIRGAGSCFSAGYDLGADLSKDLAFHSAGGAGYWARHAAEGCFRIWDLAKPVIAQVHGYCLAGGTELAASCDLVYVADDAQIGYPAVRSISPPDNQFYPWVIGMRRAMEMMLTGDSISGQQAAEWGFANASFPLAELESQVLRMAERVAKIPPDIQQINKRAVHRQMEAMGMRNGIRAGTELQALSLQTASHIAWTTKAQTEGIKSALNERDGAFGDYRTSDTERTTE